MLNLHYTSYDIFSYESVAKHLPTETTRTIGTIIATLAAGMLMLLLLSLMYNILSSHMSSTLFETLA